MTVLHLVRHAEPSDDGSLTERGREQARRLGARLAEINVDAIHHGPAPRAAQTATVLSGELAGVPVRESTRLDDWTPVPADGDWASYPIRLSEFLTRVDRAERDPGGARLTEAIEHFRSAGQEAVLVTHAYVVGWFVAAALETPAHRWADLFPDHAGLTTISYPGDRPPRLLRFNDTGGLRG